MKEGWEIKKLGEVCDIINGFAFKSQLFKDCGDDILRISNIQNGIIDDSDIAHFSKEDYPKVNFEKYAVLPNDIVVALSGATTGKFGINNTGRKLYLNQRVAICREKTNEIHHLFLLYFLKTQSKSFLESAAGVAQPNLSTEQMKQYDILVPPFAEQEKIVAELDCLSGIIEKKKQQLKEYDALAQSIFYEMFGNPVENEKGWKENKLGEIVKSSMIGLIRNGKEQDISFPYLYFKMNNIGNNGEVDWTKYTRVNASPKEVEKYSLKKGDFLFNTRNSYELVGKTCIYKIEGNDECVFNNNIMRLEFNKSINVYYISHLFQNQYIKEQLDKIKRGTTNVWAIYYKDLEKINILIPSIDIQNIFASKIEAIEKQKALIKKSIEEVETLFNSRMDYYFN